MVSMRRHRSVQGDELLMHAAQPEKGSVDRWAEHPSLDAVVAASTVARSQHKRDAVVLLACVHDSSAPVSAVGVSIRLVGFQKVALDQTADEAPQVAIRGRQYRS